MIPEIHISDYSYPLTDDRIAKYPLSERDASKLLVYRDGTVTESKFRNLAGYLPESALMVFNDTRVVPARLFFRRTSGALIEIFCLEPVSPVEYNLAFAATDRCSWKCVIGNAKRWKDDILLFDCPEGSEAAAFRLQARLLERTDRTGTVEFTWTGAQPFSRVLECCGQVPIPPYLNRRTESIDKERYQTLYAHIRGSVAAPTAGLHFTPEVLSAIDARGLKRETVCLHVGAGTFLPVKGDRVREHAMHREPFYVPLSLLRDLRTRRGCVAVGTTSVRTLESLYYMGVHCIEEGAPADVEQWEPYERSYPYSTDEALDALIGWMEGKGLDTLEAGTRIIIVPGFRFRLTEAMVTNFHQSESTLILLVAAFVGEDWRKIYDYALSHDFRFLSYGDSSLLYRNSEIYG
ncbi:MAG: S-adenosylmethionine:tRNA ribosyltransferase-isomerase [Bacteroidales bacterium]|nr:S-adenosylmethionine:tRNA ribosyltransferase-isomerase [Bacteroidales bacterium]